MQFAVSRLNVSEGSGFANISVNKVGRTAIPVTVQFATQDGSAVGEGREEREGEEREEEGREGGREEEGGEGGRGAVKCVIIFVPQWYCLIETFF